MDNTIVYKSKKGIIIYLPIAIILAVSIVIIANGGGVLPIILLMLSIISLTLSFFNTSYTINGTELKIVSGVFYRSTINIASVRKIVKSRNILSSPALSFDRIEVFYNKFDSVLISPENTSEFVADLKAINPAIETSL